MPEAATGTSYDAVSRETSPDYEKSELAMPLARKNVAAGRAINGHGLDDR